MKYYIVLNAVNNTDRNSLFARPKTFTRDEILKQYRAEDNLKVFQDYQQAVDFARAFSHNARPPKAGGATAAIVTAQLQDELEQPVNETKVLTLDGESGEEKCNLISVPVAYREVPRANIAESNLLKAEFVTRGNPSVDLTERSNLVSQLYHKLVG